MRYRALAPDVNGSASLSCALGHIVSPVLDGCVEQRSVDRRWTRPQPRACQTLRKLDSATLYINQGGAGAVERIEKGCGTNYKTVTSPFFFLFCFGFLPHSLFLTSPPQTPAIDISASNNVFIEFMGLIRAPVRVLYLEVYAISIFRYTARSSHLSSPCTPRHAFLRSVPFYLPWRAPHMP